MKMLQISRLAALLFVGAAAFGLLLTGCDGAAKPDAGIGRESSAATAATHAEGSSGVYYEIFVRSFADSNGDGIGDLNGLANKLDYVKSLGVDGVWLMPIHPSRSYHGYDVTDYYGINENYGTLDDFRTLLSEAHKRGIRILMDLVVNHTSKEHPWFKDAAENKQSQYRDWYIWSSDRGGRLPADGATGSSPWHALGGDDYLGVFWGGMPDLNYDNPEVRKEMTAIGRYWLEMGVDGFRLDAAKHIFGDFGSTLNTQQVKNKNLAWWQEFRLGLNAVNPDAYLVGEVWDTPSVIGPYLNDAFDSAFNFDLAGKLIDASASEKASDIGYALSRIYEFFSKSSNGKFTDAPFLSNHDQNRVMSTLGGNADHAKTAAAMLLTMPGTPFIYYGEELGMTGKKPDERIREPFPWMRVPGAPEETTWQPSVWRGDGSVSVEAEDEDSDSLLNRYRMLISWRKQDASLRGNFIGEYEVNQTAVMAYTRGGGDERRLVLTNLSGQSQTVNLSAGSAESPAFAEIVFTTDAGAVANAGKATLPAFATVVLKTSELSDQTKL